MRADPDFKKFVEELSRFKSNQESCDIKPARITKAMLNQFIKYPELEREIRNFPLKKKK